MPFGKPFRYQADSGEMENSFRLARNQSKGLRNDKNIKCESEESADQDGGPYSFTSIHISSVDNSSVKTSIEYDVDATLEIKEEVTQDEEIKQRGEYSLLSGMDQSDEKFRTTGSSSHNYSNPKTFFEYNIGETLDAKEGIMQDHHAKEHELKLCTVDRSEADNLVVIDKLRTHEEQEIEESRYEPEKKYKCEKCARSYTLNKLLNRHKKFECDVMPQFSCQFCGKRFNQKHSMIRHEDLVHLKSNSQTSQTRFHCDKCSRSYTLLNNLNEHKRVEHAAVKPQFTCDFCGHKTNRKNYLLKHIASRHLKTSQSKHGCDECSRSYVSIHNLQYHKREKHASL